MKVSVAMTTYNGEKYLVEQLDSIKNQTHPVDEVIILDDISKDNTFLLVEEYIEKNGLSEKWFITRNEKNLGYADNFFAAMNKTTGDVIFFCDQDDIWIENRVEKMVAVMEKHPEVMMLGSEFEPFACSEDAPTIDKKVLAGFHGDGSLEKKEFTPGNVFIGSEGCTMCIRRAFIERTKAFWFSGWAHDEYVWKLSLCEDGCYILHEKTLLRRMHSSNVSKRKMRDLSKRILFFETLIKSHEHTLEYGKKIGMDAGRCRLLERNIKATKLRVDMMKNKKLFHIIPLTLCYLDCYHSKKSIPVEFLMALKG